MQTGSTTPDKGLNCSIEIAPRVDGPGFRLTARQLLGRPREEIFEFFSQPKGLQDLTPPWIHFTVLEPTPSRITAGTLIDYQLRIHGIPLRWQSCISVWEPPLRFVDEQTRGPYRTWHHEHRFEPVEAGTLCHDTVDYQVPGGRLIHALFVRNDLLKIFAYRQQVLGERFGGA